MRFCQIRRTSLPQLERAGAVSDLNIAVDAGLLEPVHIVFFPNNIAGAEFNFYGPRMSRLGYYLRGKSGNVVPLATFHPLLRGDVSAQLDHLTELRLVNLRIKASYTDVIRGADRSLGEAFAANARVLGDDVEELELILRPARGGRRGALNRLIEPIKRILRMPDLREITDRLQVRGRHDETNKIETIDLLRDQFILRKQVLRLSDRSRAVDEQSAYDAIRSAYAEVHDELGTLSSLVL